MRLRMIEHRESSGCHGRVDVGEAAVTLRIAGEDRDVSRVSEQKSP
jgi:hypothetical protein